LAKTQQLQIRVSAAQKALLKKRAAAAGLDLSTFVLRRVLLDSEAQLEELLALLADEHEPRATLARIGGLLGALDSASFRELTAAIDVSRLTPFHQNYLAAMVEYRADQLGLPAPRWTKGVGALGEPYFPAGTDQVRTYLLRAAPIVFKRRNLFVDASVGDHL
jgi:uncharacterized protein (DUF1778 family)